MKATKRPSAEIACTGEEDVGRRPGRPGHEVEVVRPPTQQATETATRPGAIRRRTRRLGCGARVTARPPRQAERAVSVPSRTSPASRPSSIRAISSLARRTAACEMRWLISSWVVVSVIWLGSPALGGRRSWPRRPASAGAGGQHPQAGDEDRLGEGGVVHVAAGEPAVQARLEGVQAPDGRLGDALVDQQLAGGEPDLAGVGRLGGRDHDRARVRGDEGERGPGQVGGDPGAELARAQGPLAEVAALDAVVEPGLDPVGAPDRRLVDALVDQEPAGGEGDVVGVARARRGRRRQGLADRARRAPRRRSGARRPRTRRSPAAGRGPRAR